MRFIIVIIGFLLLLTTNTIGQTNNGYLLPIIRPVTFTSLPLYFQEYQDYIYGNDSLYQTEVLFILFRYEDFSVIKIYKESNNWKVFKLNKYNSSIKDIKTNDSKKLDSIYKNIPKTKKYYIAHCEGNSSSSKYHYYIREKNRLIFQLNIGNCIQFDNLAEGSLLKIQEYVTFYNFVFKNIIPKYFSGGVFSE